MKEIAVYRGRTLITGSAGFIGSHLCAHLEKSNGSLPPTSLRRIPVDLSGTVQLLNSLNGTRPEHVIHLAAEGSVGTPLEEGARMIGSAVDKVYRVLNVLQPRRMVLTSSCAVYGNTKLGRPYWEEISPVGMYGMSKASTELAARLWTEQENSSLVVLRLGNVVGEGCGGLIAYLVRHAFKYPDGSKPALMRGEGKVVRDYVPIEHVVNALLAGIRFQPSGSSHFSIFNIGTGRGTTNREVAEIVCSVLEENGFKLRISWHSGLALGEALQAVLDVSETEQRLELPTPGYDSVVESIRRGTLSHLEEAFRSSDDGIGPAVRLAKKSK